MAGSLTQLVLSPSSLLSTQETWLSLSQHIARKISDYGRLPCTDVASHITFIICCWFLWFAYNIASDKIA